MSAHVGLDQNQGAEGRGWAGKDGVVRATPGTLDPGREDEHSQKTQRINQRTVSHSHSNQSAVRT